MPRTRTSPRELIGRFWLEKVGITVTEEMAAGLFDTSREKIITGGWQAGKSTG